MFKKIAFIIFIVACAVGGIWWLIYVKEIKTPVSAGINAIPTNATIIFESKQSRNVWKKLSQTNIMWEELISTETFSKMNATARYVDSMVNLNIEMTELLDNHSVLISAHVSSDNSFDLLYIYSLPNITHQSSIEEFFKTINNKTLPVLVDYAGVNIGTIHPKEKPELNFAFLNGTLMMSAKRSLVEESIRQLKSGTSLAKDKYFSKVLSSAGKNVDANVYINYKNFPKLLNHFSSKETTTQTSSLARFADCSGWDITIKPNALMLSGFTQANDSTNTFLSLFSKQKPREIELTKIIPSKTALLLFFGISDIKTFQTDYKNYLSKKHQSSSYTGYVKGINAKYNINIENTIVNRITNEIALVITEPNSPDFAPNTYAVLHTSDGRKAESAMIELANTINKEDDEKPDSTSFRNHKIMLLNLPGVLPQLLGWQFSKIKTTWFTTIEKYMVFANSPEALKRIINDFENNKTLFNNKNYKSFSENISSEASVYLYSAIARSSDFYSSFLTEDLSKEIQNKLLLFKKFEAVGIQFTNNNHAFYSSIYFKYNPAQKQETGTLWEAKLDTTVSSKPFLLINHNTNAKEVLVQDDANKIYLISNTGKIIWTKELPEKIISDVVQIDVLKNKKLQMLFNTRSYIYMYDRNGNDMKGFPIKLKSTATNPLTVADYDNNKDYRIFIATENKHILCYKADGEQVTTFKFDKTANTVFLPLQYFKSNGKDHLCIVDTKGKIYILDKRGETKVKIKDQFNQGIPAFFIDADNEYAKTYILAADTLGNITKYSLTGKKETIHLQEFATSPYFDYRDLNNDAKPEYIFLTRNQLKVYSPNKTVLFKYDFKDTLTQPSQFFLFRDWTTNIGVISEKNNKLYLFNDTGNLMDGFPKTGKTPFCLDDLNNEGVLNLITGSSDGSIYVYQLQ